MSTTLDNNAYAKAYRDNFRLLSHRLATRYPFLDAEDIVQTAFARLWRYSDRMTDISPTGLRKFLTRTVKGLAVRSISRIMGKRRLADMAERRYLYRGMVDDPLPDSDDTLPTLSRVGELPEILRLRYLEKMSVDDICKHYAISPVTYHKRKNQAIDKCREALGISSTPN